MFHTFENNLYTIRGRFQTINSDYDTASQDVLIPAFIAAYLGKDAQTVALTPFPGRPLPNWRLDYSGLSKLGIFKDVFQSVAISHAYVSSYSVSNFSNSLPVYRCERSAHRSFRAEIITTATTARL